MKMIFTASFISVFSELVTFAEKDAGKYPRILKTEFTASANIVKAEAAIEKAKNQPKKEK
jgi:hypothetical protein